MTTQTKTQLTGWATLAGVLLLLVGGFNAVYGITAIVNKHIMLVSGNGQVSIWDVTTWGWITLFIGAFQAATAFALFWRMEWARWSAVVLAGISAVGQVSIISLSPWWSLSVIALDVLIIYHLVQQRPAAA